MEETITHPKKPVVIQEIADIIRIWRKGRLYMLPDYEKQHAKRIIIEEIERNNLPPAQLNTLEILRNVLEG